MSWVHLRGHSSPRMRGFTDYQGLISSKILGLPCRITISSILRQTELTLNARLAQVTSMRSAGMVLETARCVKRLVHSLRQSSYLECRSYASSNSQSFCFAPFFVAKSANCDRCIVAKGRGSTCLITARTFRSPPAGDWLMY
jgi:hypothetical protein